MTSDPQLLRGFSNAAQSLKLYRRADIIDQEDGASLIDELYVDPLPSGQVLDTLLRPNTTFVIGRKGTGKSTVFQRLQSAIRAGKSQTSAYVDIKTVYESAQIDDGLRVRLESMESAMPPETLRQLLLYRAFLREVVSEIKNELRKVVQSSLWHRIKEGFSGTQAELFADLDELLDDASEEKFMRALGVHVVSTKASAESSNEASTTASVKAQIAATPSFAGSAAASEKVAGGESIERAYTDVLIPALSIKEFIVRLKVLLERLGIRNLVVVVDDFSELPEGAMHVVVDALIAPLNNWSDEFVKFKIAAYPGRIYFGAIDKTKIDEIYLDSYRLYGGSDVTTMETSGSAFIQRLIESRLKHYCSGTPAEFFENDLDEIYRQLYFASMGNPRILGFLLHFAYESRVISGRRIGISAIHDAARRFFEEKVESYFTIGKFLHETFAERASIFSLKELLESIVFRARELRAHESSVFKKIVGRPPTSHFHVPVEYDALFSTLELNFFITKYFEMSDRDGRKVSVYALNYGLCRKYALSFGRPSGEREFRLYYVERIFDYTTIVKQFLDRNQEIVCVQCGYRYAPENLEALHFFRMRCKECVDGHVQVNNLSRKYEAELRAVSDALLLPKLELGILQTLHDEGEAVRPGFVAGELDCSYQLIGKRAKSLADRGLLKRLEDEQGRRLLEIEPSAESAYFAAERRESLEIPADDSEGDQQ
ncbi:MAG: hypothetical protein ACPHN2_20970 [Sinimarinibacterium flocculans]|uniref:hypothetical protein n=1 Tax=Sinimarinibacterium flocculans TaxID=985250 RepID=UPI003C496B42